MTIKAIKEKYRDYAREAGFGGRTSFAVWDWNNGNGKCVIVVGITPYWGDEVVQVVRVSDGRELLDGDESRPCDNLDDAIDVAGEMIPNEILPQLDEDVKNYTKNDPFDEMPSERYWIRTDEYYPKGFDDFDEAIAYGQRLVEEAKDETVCDVLDTKTDDIYGFELVEEEEA